MAERALIVIDVQNEYFPGGVWALPDSGDALPNILQLISLARERGEGVVFIRHLLPAGAPLFAEGSPGSELHPQLEVRSGEPVFTKQHPSAFQETGLLDHLQNQGVTSLDVCGFMTQMCCDTMP